MLAGAAKAALRGANPARGGRALGRLGGGAAGAGRAPLSTAAVFPRETEGNVYAVNWSLTEDGVVPVGSAFRNARLPVLTTRLPAKLEGGKVEVPKIAYSGAYKLVEAGEGISHGAFTNVLADQQAYLSSGVDIFVEDAGLGASSGLRLGVRVVTDSTAVALVARTLLIPVPERPVDHRARFDGWNFDPRWEEPEIKWTGTSYAVSDVPTTPAKGQRPVVAYVGGAGDAVAVQFVESNKKIVGANVSVGGSAPVRALVEAVGLASTVVINALNKDALALASATLVKGSNTVVVVGADDSVVDAALNSSLVYGAYHNVVTASGVSALWNGVISAPTAAKATGKFVPPIVTSGGKAAVALAPDNLANAPKAFVFFEKGKGKAAISEEEAVKRLVAATDDSKLEVAKALVKGVKCYTAGSFADIEL